MSTLGIISISYILILLIVENIKKFGVYLNAIFYLFLMLFASPLLGNGFNMPLMASLTVIVLISQNKEDGKLTSLLFLSLLPFYFSSLFEFMLLIPMVKTLQVLIKKEVDSNEFFGMLFYLLMVFACLLFSGEKSGYCGLFLFVFLYIEKNLSSTKEIKTLGIDYIHFYIIPYSFIMNYKFPGEAIWLGILSLVIVIEIIKLFFVSEKSSFLESIFSLGILPYASTIADQRTKELIFLVITVAYLQKYILIEFNFIKKLFTKLNPINLILIVLVFIINDSFNSGLICSILIITLFFVSFFLSEESDYITTRYQLHESYILNFTAATLSILFIMMLFAVKIFL